MRRDPGGRAEEVLNADLVVDASGRGSRLPAWLAALGYPVPEVERVSVGLTYTSRLYRREPAHLQGDTFLVLTASPAARRIGAILAQEGNRWIVTLAGYFGDHAPAEEEGFLAFARSLPVPDIYEVIKEAEPLSDPVRYGFPANQRRRYERLARFPEGLLVVGDAICSFNPIYGQGMSVAALEAIVLRECLARGTDRLAPRFFRQVGRVVDIPWRIAVGNDLRFPQVEGARGPMLRFVNGYVGRLHRAAWRDPVVALAFHRVANLMAPLPSIFYPHVALRVLGQRLRPAKGAAAARRAPSPMPPR